MSDNEASAPEVQAAETPDGSPPTSPDVSTDVAPTRKARRRAEPQSTVMQGGWGFWGDWGKSILSTATATVATVGQGLTQVIEKAETSLGIPSPAELSVQAADDEKAEEQQRREAGEMERPAGAMGMLTSLTSVVQNTVSPNGATAQFRGMPDDRDFHPLSGELQQVLREAKEREELQTEESSDSEKKPVAHYGVLFDQYQGLICHIQRRANPPDH
uniref:Family with sequence similarity 114 member A2 n=1 Tax=Hippocampus comes TaxID=109280 RepID=A0A3Q2YPP0_HIPCM